MEKMLPTIFTILFFLAMIFAMIIFRINKDRLDRRSNIYLFLMLLMGATTGVLTWVCRYFELEIFTTYILLQVLYLGLGGLHVYFLYKFMWSIRDNETWDRDSFIPETAFTIYTSHLVVIGMVASFYLITKDISTGVNFWNLFIPFTLPFAIIKSYDLMKQIPNKEFDTKWNYQLTELDESKWAWANLVEIHFQVIDAFENEEKFRADYAWFSIQAPRDQPLTQVYRLALKYYHNKPEHTINVQDIGYEFDPPVFWWLFHIKFHLFKPRTWFVKSRYLDPNASLEQNRLQNHDVITATRIAH